MSTAVNEKIMPSFRAALFGFVGTTVVLTLVFVALGSF